MQAGVCNLFLAREPLAGRRARPDDAPIIEALADAQAPDAERIVLAQDNLNTHRPAAPHEAFSAAEAERLADRLEVDDTPERGNWLNVVELEPEALAEQRSDHPLADRAPPARRRAALGARRNAAARAVS
jgi:hypothetical protein